jgi:hypothetical protein
MSFTKIMENNNMVKIREYQDTDFEQIVQMYYCLLHEVYPNHKIKGIAHCYQNVLNWINWNYDIMVTYKDDEITGFGLCYMDSMGGAVEDYYQGEIIYIKPEYRKGRSAYLIYHTAMIMADKYNMILATNASDVTESSHISKKLGQQIYTHYERIPNVTR